VIMNGFEDDLVKCIKILKNWGVEMETLKFQKETLVDARKEREVIDNYCEEDLLKLKKKYEFSFTTFLDIKESGEFADVFTEKKRVEGRMFNINVIRD